MEALLERTTLQHLEPALRHGVRQAQKLGKPVVVSLVEATPVFDAISLFERSEAVAAERFLWAQPGEGFAFVGLGVAQAIEVTAASRFQQAEAAWRHLLEGGVHAGLRGLPGTGPLLLGGFAFDAERPATELWEGFPAGRLILPRLLCTREHGDAWLTYIAVLNPEDDPLEEAEALAQLGEQVLAAEARPRLEASPAPVITHELRPAAEWQADVANAACAVAQGELEKVVLARAVQLESTRAFQAGRALRHLAAHYHGCYIFAVAHGERCFLGATPEQLLRLRNGEVRTMSLAGSIRRGKTPEEDRLLGETLLESVKDRSEHAVVVRAMVEALYETCSSLNVSETSLLKLGNIQHLCTLITGELADGQTLLDLVEHLHPTPAVGGRPRDLALNWIRQYEKLDRGWYAGPVGWVNARGDGEFAVALRSALLHGERATLFAGCGIMADSDPQREYAESTLKLKPMLAALQ